jgi:hypothetical protein
MIPLKQFIVKQQGEPETFTKEFCDFASKRYDGAKKISDDAKKKGGPALLTHHHFVVKLPYYETAKGGGFNILTARNELKERLTRLGVLQGTVKMNQIEFQELVGVIEVLGELIIKWNETKR